MDNSTHKGHVEYTRDEYANSAYYQGVLSHLKEANIKYSVDVGACVGEVTKMLIETIPSLISCVMIEPLKDNVKFITDNLIPKMSLIPKALYYGSNEVNLGKLDNVGGASMFVNSRIEKCQAMTLEEIETPIDFVKIDVEGGEMNIIENSPRLKEIKFVEIEFHHYCGDLNKVEYVKKWLPNHKILLEKGNSLFLSL